MPGDWLIMRRPGVPLSALFSGLSPNGPTIVVQKDGETGTDLVRPGVGGKQLEWMASISPIVVVIRVDRIAPRLSSNEDWIVADVGGTIDTVAKQSATESLATGTKISFAQDGGELIVAGRRVKAVLPYADGYAVGNRYLLFAGRFPGGSLTCTRRPTTSSILMRACARWQNETRGRILKMALHWPTHCNGFAMSAAAIA